MELVDQIMQELLDGQTVYTTERGYTSDDARLFLSVEDSEALSRLINKCIAVFIDHVSGRVNNSPNADIVKDIGFYHHRALLEMAKHIEPDVAKKRKQDDLIDKAGDELNWRDM